MRNEADWILKAMIVVAAADARLDAREVKTIREIYPQQTGRETDMGTVVLAVQTYARRAQALEDLSTAAVSMDRQTRETIFRAAALTAAANAEIAATERARLAAIAAALQLSDDEAQAIIADAKSTRSD